MYYFFKIKFITNIHNLFFIFIIYKNLNKIKNTLNPINFDNINLLSKFFKNQTFIEVPLFQKRRMNRSILMARISFMKVTIY